MEWPKVKLDSIKADVRYALVGGPFGSNLTTRDYVEEGVPVIRGNNLPADSLFLDDDFVFVTEEKADDLQSNIAYPGDIIFTQRGTLGQVGIIPLQAQFPRYVISQSQMKLSVDPEKADARFVYYFFRMPSTVQAVINHALTSGVPHINLGILKEFEILRPHITVQERLANILSAYDDLIENNQRRMALLEEAARQLYREWFVRLRFPGYEHTRLTDGVPEGWERKPIAELTTFVSRGIAPHYDDDEEGLVINQKCIRNGRLDLMLARHQAREFKPDRQVQPGDVLVNSTGEGTLGRVAQVVSPIPNCTVDTHVTIVRPRADVGRHYFGMAVMDWEPRFSIMGRGATNQTELSRGQIGEAEILVPSNSLVQQFEEFAAPLFGQVVALMEQNQKLRTARDLLLPRLMGGEIAV
ncbi:MAG: restriction endonuclease subunit S [Candidatus Tectimicrobiota bacterium]